MDRHAVEYRATVKLLRNRQVCCSYILYNVGISSAHTACVGLDVWATMYNLMPLCNSLFIFTGSDGYWSKGSTGQGTSTEVLHKEQSDETTADLVLSWWCQWGTVQAGKNFITNNVLNNIFYGHSRLLWTRLLQYRRLVWCWSQATDPGSHLWWCRKDTTLACLPREKTK